ncbi:MAG: DUF6588 family protein [bacterium]|nr:DUF6588 family protein [bacterium]
MKPHTKTQTLTVYITVFITCILFICAPAGVRAQAPLWNPLAVDVTRNLLKDLFETNAVPYIQPMITTVNATSNAAFYNTAYIPDTNAPYVKISLRGMVGFIRDDQKSYSPTLDLGAPSQNLVTDVTRFGTIDVINRKFVIKPTYEDTLGLTMFLLREILIDAQKQGKFNLPPVAPTLFGNQPDTRVYLPPSDTLLAVLRSRQDYQALLALSGPGLDSSLSALVGQLSLPDYLTLPPGANMSTLVAAVPQIEIGALYGTELLLRFIPPVQFDKNIGKFAFWGVGLKHSISQYFPERYFDLAVQGVYQGTTLTNTVGFTGSELNATAHIASINVHASKRLANILDVYSGFAYENIDVTSTYIYIMPQEVQVKLGLLPTPPLGQAAVPTPEQPGDTKPQTSIIEAGDTNVKWTVGFSLLAGPVRLFADYSISSFNIFSGGIEVVIGQ